MVFAKIGEVSVDLRSYAAGSAGRDAGTRCLHVKIL